MNNKTTECCEERNRESYEDEKLDSPSLDTTRAMPSTIQVKEDDLYRMYESIKEVLSPMVIFDEDIEKMRNEANRVRLANTKVVQEILQRYLNKNHRPNFY